MDVLTDDGIGRIRLDIVEQYVAKFLQRLHAFGIVRLHALDLHTILTNFCVDLRARCLGGMLLVRVFDPCLQAKRGKEYQARSSGNA